MIQERSKTVGVMHVCKTVALAWTVVALVVGCKREPSTAGSPARTPQEALARYIQAMATGDKVSLVECHMGSADSMEAVSTLAECLEESRKFRDMFVQVYGAKSWDTFRERLYEETHVKIHWEAETDLANVRAKLRLKEIDITISGKEAVARGGGLSGHMKLVRHGSSWFVDADTLAALGQSRQDPIATRPFRTRTGSRQRCAKRLLALTKIRTLT